MKLNIKTKSSLGYFLQNRLPGFTFIEAMTVLFVFSVISLAFYSLISSGTRFIQDSKNRLGALAVANEKTEIVRNLQYDDIGTVGGEIEGNIPQDETVIENTRQYNVHTLVEYVDDSFDGTGYSDTVWFEDYKRVTITVSWSGINGGQEEVKLVSRFVPPGLEVAHPGDGILSVNIFSDQPGGTGISGSTVHIFNSETGLDTQKQTDASGNAMFMGSNVTDSIQKYEITVTKAEYETVSTMPPYPDTPYNPTDVHASVVTGSINVTNIVQNKLAELETSTVNYLDQPIGNIDFHLVGGRKIGTEVDLPNGPKYNIDGDYQTNAGGEKDFGSVSPGQYQFNLSSSVTGYELIETDPDCSYENIDGKEVYSFSLSSDQSLDFKVKLAEKDAASLLVKVVRDDEGTYSPVAGAVVELSNDSSYHAAQTSGANGRVFFPTTSDEFEPGTYDLKITAEGFQENNSQVTVSVNELKIEQVSLTSQ